MTQGIVLNINPYNKNHIVKIDGVIHRIPWETMHTVCKTLRVGDTFDIITVVKHGQQINKFIPVSDYIEYEMLTSNCKTMVVYDAKN